MFPFNMAISEISAGECSMAEATGEGSIAFRTSMEVRVSFEVLIACEATVTDIALEWLLSAHGSDGRHCRVAEGMRKVSTTQDQRGRA